MALKYLKPESESHSWVVATERLWLTADKDRLVADDDPDAAFLFCTPGQQVPLVDAQRYGLAEGAPVEEPVVPVEVPAEPVEPAEDKQAEPEEAKPAKPQRGKKPA